MESVVKNCGSPIHEEVASKAFMDELREMVHKTTNDKVRAKVLELVQTWAFAFRNSPKYSIIPVSLLKIDSIITSFLICLIIRIRSTFLKRKAILFQL